MQHNRRRDIPEKRNGKEDQEPHHEPVAYPKVKPRIEYKRLDRSAEAAYSMRRLVVRVQGSNEKRIDEKVGDKATNPDEAVQDKRAFVP